MKHILLIASFFIFCCFTSLAQQTCEVKLKDIQGTYTGECANDKANGKGKSVGVDEYEGEFKDGYPEGKGMYTWKDGHYFVGFFKKGNKEGKGDMYYESAKGEDSIIAGFWKKDKYVGEYEHQFIVQSQSGRISKVNCRFVDKKTRNITIEVHQLSNGAGVQTQAYIPTVGDVSVLNGTYYSKNSHTMTNSSVTYLKDVTYPFRAIFTLTTGDATEIIFNEPGEYAVTINIL